MTHRKSTSLGTHFVSPSPAPSVLARLRASAWVPIALRVCAVAVALLVLAWIGRTAAAGPTSASSVAAADRDASTTSDHEAPIDAGASPGSPLAAQPVSPSPATASTTRAHAGPNDPVFINHAGVEDLRRLPGVGPKRAEAILVLRQRLGRFQRLEDLLRVKGIGRGAVKKWRPLVRLDAPAPENPGDGGLH